jgi:hypothetical protein
VKDALCCCRPEKKGCKREREGNGREYSANSFQNPQLSLHRDRIQDNKQSKGLTGTQTSGKEASEGGKRNISSPTVSLKRNKTTHSVMRDMLQIRVLLSLK